MDLEERLSASPFLEFVGVDIVTVDDGYAKASVEYTDDLLGIPDGDALQGGVVSTLADAVGGIAVSSRAEKPTPTIDIRIDYLAPAVGDIFAEARVRRIGESVGVSDIDVYHVEGDLVATGRGVFKTAGAKADSAWGTDSE